MQKDYLILKRASVSRSSGQWSDDDFDVLAEGVVVGRRDFAPRSSMGTLQLSTRCSSLAFTPSRSFAVRISPTSLASPSARAIAPGATNATSTRSVHGTMLTGIT